MKPLLLVACILLQSGLVFSQREWKKFLNTRVRQVSVAKGDSLITFGICEADEKIRCKRNRNYYWYSRNGLHVNRGSYDGYLINGTFSVFNLKGNLLEKGEIQMGTKEGVWTIWYPDGEKHMESKFRRGQIRGRKKIYSADGQVVSKIRYRNGIPKKPKETISKADGKRDKTVGENKKSAKKGSRKLKYEVIDDKEAGGKKPKKKDKTKDEKELYRFFKDLFKSKNKEEGKVA